MTLDPRAIDLGSLGDFPPGAEERWTAAAARALGALTLDRLARRTVDGLAMPPLSPPRRDAAPMQLRIASSTGPRGWVSLQTVAIDRADANAVILDHLSGGVGGLDLTLDDPAAAARLPAILDRALAGVHREMVQLALPSCALLDESLQLIQYFSRSGAPAAAGALVHAGIDPVLFEASLPSRRRGAPGSRLDAAALLAALDGLDPASSAVTADGQYWHALGATEVQQLTLAVASGIAWLDRLAGLDGDGAALAAGGHRIVFRLVADQNQFLTIAKLRAFRRLWALVRESWGLAPAPAVVHAVPAWRMLTRRDPWVNILRNTVAAAAAALGGADAVLTLPHTALLGTADADARRLSRNIQAILMEESNLAAVGDPAAGSGGIEALTDALSDAAWEGLRQIEREGGLAASLESGALFARIAEADQAQRKLVATRRHPITGTSTWPLIDERVEGISGPPDLPAPGEGLSRLAEPWEALRDRSDAHLADTGRRPRLMIVNLGPVAAHITRTNWAKNLFEAGGIECLQASAGTGDIATLGSRIAGAGGGAGAAVACLCSSDAVYAELALPAAQALKAAGIRHLLLAGKGGELEASYRAAGVDRFVHEGLDMLALVGSLIDIASAG